MSLPIRQGELIERPGTKGWMVYVRETDSLHSLNETARAIWDLCDGHTSPEEMADAIAELTGLDPETSLAEINLALERLRQSGLVNR